MTDELYVIYRKPYEGKRVDTLRRMKPGDAINVPINQAKGWVDGAYNIGLKVKQRINRPLGYTTIFVLEPDYVDDDEAPE